MKFLVRIARHRNSLLLVVALALGGVAAFGARGYIATEIAAERERLQPRQDTIPIVVAKRAIDKGEVASAENMAVRDVPREYVASGTVTPDRFDGYAGSRLSVPMRAGEPLMHAMLEGADVSTFSAKVQAGIRALTIAVDEINSLSGMLQPGDRIDLMLSARLPAAGAGAPPQEITRALMQDLKVLATGRQVRPGGDERQSRAYTAITVEVTPEQAQRLVVAQRSGKLTAMLRNPGDRAPIAQAPLDVYGLLDLAPARGDAGPAPRAPDLIIGGHGPLKVVAGLAQAGSAPSPPVLTAPARWVASGAGAPIAGAPAIGAPAIGASAMVAPGTPPAPTLPGPPGGPAPLPSDSTSDVPGARSITIR